MRERKSPPEKNRADKNNAFKIGLKGSLGAVAPNDQGEALYLKQAHVLGLEFVYMHKGCTSIVTQMREPLLELIVPCLEKGPNSVGKRRAAGLLRM